MNPTFELIILKTELTQSDFFGTQYDDLLNNPEHSAFSSPLIQDVDELRNSVLLKYDNLTEFQKEMLIRIFDEFNNIRINIDPNRLKPFQHYYNSDNELLLYRESPKGLTNIIINSDECIAFSFIPKTNEKRVLYFIPQEETDFERLAYDFFSF